MNTKALELSALYKELAEQDTWFEFKCKPPKWEKSIQSPTIDSDLRDWRVADKQVIDLSCMVSSGIDMEFRNYNGIWWTTQLNNINECTDKKYESALGDKYNSSECRIRQDHWHSWQGGKCPLPKGLNINIKTRAQSSESYDVESYDVSYWGWKWNIPEGDNSGDIIAFKIIGAANGWKY